MPIKEITESFSLDRIVPFFQPIMDLEGERVWRYECLARLIGEHQDTFLPNDLATFLNNSVVETSSPSEIKKISLAALGWSIQ